MAFEKRNGHLYCHLPSGRALVYRNARIADVVPSYMKDAPESEKKTVRSVVYQSPRFALNSLYGGKLAENVVQAVARDFMANALVNCEQTEGIRPCLHVHDEGVGSLRSESLFEAFMRAMTTPPAWALDFPLDAEGSCLPRYAKSPPPGVKEVVWRNGRFYK